MKIKNYLGLTLGICLLLTAGCKKEVHPDYETLLIGTWINSAIDGNVVKTDNAFVCDLRADKSGLYALGVDINDDNKLWIENDDFSYSIDGDEVTIEGTDVLNRSIKIEIEIKSISATEFTGTFDQFKVDGVNYSNSKIYTFKKLTTNYSAQFVGVWYGHCTSAGTTDTKYHYWEYFADGSYKYYYQDENDNWVLKEDNNGAYFLYGNYFASNYSNDLLSGGTGLAYECWNISIAGNQMTWTGLRDNGAVVTYEMEKRDAPPVIE